MAMCVQEVRVSTGSRISLIPVSSGLIYRAMGTCGLLSVIMVLTSTYIGFPLDFFPVLFAVPRVVGWLAHWRQVRLNHARETGTCNPSSLPQMMIQEGGVKIWRPRQVRVRVRVNFHEMAKSSSLTCSPVVSRSM